MAAPQPQRPPRRRLIEETHDPLVREFAHHPLPPGSAADGADLEPVVRAMQIQAEQHADPDPRRSVPFDHEAALASIITKNREVDAARAVHKRRAEDTKSAKQVLDDLATQLSEMIAEFGARLDGTGNQPTLFNAAAHVDVGGMCDCSQRGYGEHAHALDCAWAAVHKESKP